MCFRKCDNDAVCSVPSDCKKFVTETVIGYMGQVTRQARKEYHGKRFVGKE